MKSLLLLLLLSALPASSAVVGRTPLAVPMSAHVTAVMPYMGQPTLMASALSRSISELGATREAQLAGRLLIEAIATGDAARIRAIMGPAAAAAPGAVSQPAAAPGAAPAPDAPGSNAAVMADLNRVVASLPARLARAEFTLAASPTAQRIHKALHIESNADLDSMLAQTFDGSELRDALADTPARNTEVLAANPQAGRRSPFSVLGRFIPRAQPRVAPAIEGASPSPAAAPRLSAADNMLNMAELLRNAHIDPRRTHVVELARLLPEHLQYARNAILKQKTEPERLKTLREFEREAVERSVRGSFTYQYWNDFNYRLSILMTPSNKRTDVAGGSVDKFAAEVRRTGAWLTDEQFRQAADRQPKEFFGDYAAHNVAKVFPARVVLPTIDGEIPSEDMNAMFGTKVAVLGLIDGMMRVDGREMWPDHFYRHDHVHASNEEFAEMRYELEDRELTTLRANYLSWRDTLDGDRRRAFEFGYHMATHELPLADELIRSGGSRLGGRSELVGHLRNPDWYAGHAPAWALRSDAAARRFIAMTDEEMAAFSRRFYPRSANR